MRRILGRAKRASISIVRIYRVILARLFGFDFKNNRSFSDLTAHLQADHVALFGAVHVFMVHLQRVDCLLKIRAMTLKFYFVTHFEGSDEVNNGDLAFPIIMGNFSDRFHEVNYIKGDYLMQDHLLW